VFGSIEDDAVRRDFSVNALYYSIADFTVHDYVGGVADVEARCLRLIGAPELSYREDPVRMLRAVRLAAKLGFSIEVQAAAAIPQMAELLAQASSARLFDECLKLFLAGHALAGFRGLQQHGLLAALFPDTDAALKADGSGLCVGLIEHALDSTDLRVREGRPVTPVFLFATLLWPAYSAEVARLLADGHQMPVAEQRGADRVLVRQCERVGIPRRIGQAVEELWRMQSRFGARQRKRALRLLVHPRFRAAFDLLEVRARVVPALAAEVQFWREAQGLDAEAMTQHLQQAQAADEAEATKPARRRPQRRRSPSVDVG
jgi:poly(A) polymerase